MRWIEISVRGDVRSLSNRWERSEDNSQEERAFDEEREVSIIPVLPKAAEEEEESDFYLDKAARADEES